LQAPAPEGANLLRPFYDPGTFAFSDVARGTSLAVLTYIGFDAVSTLSEEARDPRRDILRATVLTCLVVGLLAALQVYAAQLVWPAWHFADPETAIPQIAGRIGGGFLMRTVTLALLIATIGSGIGSQLAAGRLLYSMGRDGALPARFFGALDPKTRIPRNSILLVGAAALIGVLVLDYDTGAGLLNFGAFIGFMGVNLSALVRYSIRPRSRRLRATAPPLLGFLVCLLLWLSLPTSAQLIGIVWLGIGLGFALWQTRGFTMSKRDPTPVSESDDEAH
jgi:amino acid transporter